MSKGLGIGLGVVALITIALIGVPRAVLFVAALCIGLFAWFLFARKPQKEAPPAEESAEAPLPEWVATIQRMLELNLLTREKAAPEPVREKVEQIIDELRRLVPELNQVYSGDELTWTVNRMALDYVPRIVEPFLALDPSSRQERQEEFMRSLSGLESEITTIETLVRDRKTGDFQSKAAFLRARFFESQPSD